MRWKAKPTHLYGDVRLIRRFLWLPLELDGEVRWLERAFIQQRYFADLGGSGWYDVHFIEEEYRETMEKRFNTEMEAIEAVQEPEELFAPAEAEPDWLQQEIACYLRDHAGCRPMEACLEMAGDLVEMAVMRM